MNCEISPGDRRRDYFWAVLDAFVKCIQAPPLRAVNFDPDDKPSLRWSPMIGNFKTDVSNAIKKALPRTELQKAFWRLAVRLAYGLTSSDQLQDKMTNTVIDRCGKVFAERRLKPNQYFGKATA